VTATQPFDVAIVGLGAMGSAAALALARRGQRVLGFDRHVPPHEFGSSHGSTRIIREAYFEGAEYVPLVRRAYELWRALEAESGQSLLLQTGGLMIGRPGSELVEGARRSAELHGMPYELLDPAAVSARFPAMQLERGMVAVLEPRAGILRPEACISAQLELAAGHGARLRTEEAVERWDADGDGVRIVTAAGAYRARQLVLCAGAWMNDLVSAAVLPLRIERQVLHWFAPNGAADFAPERCPIHLWQFDGRRFFYGFPDLGAGVKAGFHHGGETTTAAAVRREVAPSEVEDVRFALRRFLPGADGALLRSTVCLYANTPDEHFWIDRLPQHPAVLVVSACSGHGFKFAPAIGEVVADQVQGRTPPFDLHRFRQRASQPPGSAP
jgi:sarcosine oxidase